MLSSRRHREGGGGEGGREVLGRRCDFSKFVVKSGRPLQSLRLASLGKAWTGLAEGFANEGIKSPSQQLQLPLQLRLKLQAYG